jgi:prefoldin subunit 5
VIIEDMSKKIEELTGHIHKLEGKIQDLIKENKQLKNKNTN